MLLAEAERGDDPRRALVEVYDHPQPATRTDAVPVEAPPSRSGIVGHGVGFGDRREDLITVGGNVRVLIGDMAPSDCRQNDVITFGRLDAVGRRTHISISPWPPKLAPPQSEVLAEFRRTGLGAPLS